jgi:poly(A) polymerase/tRNA nucleotidyltransferase (CCA-adding enzyme)
MASTDEIGGRIASQLPPGASRLTERIREAGGRICLVGGSIRDILLGLEVHDWDFATDVPPERLLALFPRAIEVGVRFGTVVVVERDGTYEATTFRREGGYSDQRHPDEVVFTESLEEDLARRDFTVNAIAYDFGASILVDPHGGRVDLGARVIRCVGRPEDRFREDALRMLRCIRIAGQLGFSIEAETYAGIVRSAEGLDRIASERIKEEFDRILTQERPSVSVERLFETGLLERFIPELADCHGVSQNRFHAFDVFYHSLLSADMAPKEHRIVRMAAILHDLGKKDTRQEGPDGRVTFYNHQAFGARKADAILRRLRYPNEERERIVHLVQQHMFHYDREWTDGAVRRFIRTIGLENLDDLFETRRADTLGNGMRRSATSPELEELKVRISEVVRQESALTVRALRVNGSDLMRDLGLETGPAIGRILEALLDEVIEDPAKNEPEYLMRRAAEILPGILASLPPRRERNRIRSQ